jgi:hypothetical protein
MSGMSGTSNMSAYGAGLYAETSGGVSGGAKKSKKTKTKKTKSKSRSRSRGKGKK